MFDGDGKHMAKRKVAVFGSGWSSDIIQAIMKGIEQYSKEFLVDVMFYVNYASEGETLEQSRGEATIFQLPVLTDYDGIVLLSNTLYLPVQIPDLFEMVRKSGVPTICMERPIKGFPYIGTDNYSGMFGIVEHMITEHQCKNFLYMSGPYDHEENVLRIKAFTDACAKYEIEVSKDQFLEGDWSEYTAKNKVTDYLKLGGALPDCFVCSNDFSAMGVITALKEQGYKVPEDVRVVGFDDLAITSCYEPPITTVGRDSEKVGYEGMKLLDQMIAGGDIPEETMIPSRVIARASCGCEMSQEALDQAVFARNHIFLNDVSYMGLDMYFRNLHNRIRTLNSMDDLHIGFSDYFGNKHRNLQNFAIFVKPGLEASDSVHYIPELIYGRQGRRTLSHMIVPMLPEIYEQLVSMQQSVVLTIVPLHTEGLNVGYAIFSWSPELLSHNWLYVWTRQMNQILELVHHNIEIHTLNQKLARLSRTDILTNVYNRIGCEELGAELLEDTTQQMKGSCVIMVDMDRMKHINDRFGHTSGDQALRNLTQIITEVCPKDYIISRFGGDEFVVVGSCESEEYMKQLIDQIDARVKAANETLKYPFSASFGGFWKRGNLRMSFEECVSRADKAMYEMKELNHQRLDETLGDPV